MFWFSEVSYFRWKNRKLIGGIYEQEQKKVTEKRTCNSKNGFFVLRIENIYNCDNYYVSYCTACICL